MLAAMRIASVLVLAFALTAAACGSSSGQSASTSGASGSASGSSDSTMPTVGSVAPDIMLQDQTGRVRTLAEFRGHPVVVYFYPRDATPGCTREAIAFSKLKAAFAKAKTEIVGVSADPVEAQNSFKTKHKLTIALGSDVTPLHIWGLCPS